METDISEHTTSTEQADPTREDYLHGVEDIIAWLRANPNLPLPIEWSRGGRVTMSAAAKQTVADIIRAMGHSEKTYDSNYFSAERAFGPVKLQVLTSRATVCQRVVKGVRTVPAREAYTVEDVEWVCEEPVLA